MVPKVSVHDAPGPFAGPRASTTAAIIVLAGAAAAACLVGIRLGVGPVLTFLAALTASWCLVPIVARWATWHGATAPPGGRSVHPSRTPLLGGLAVAIPVLFVLVVIGDVKHMSLAVACVLMVGVGAVDDLHGLSPRCKILAQALAAAVLFAGGLRLPPPFLAPFGQLSAPALQLPLQIAWILLITNAINLSDGIDGLAAGIGLVVCVACVTLGAGGVVPVVLAGALLGLLRHNLPSATIFLGDAGSQLLGLLVSVLLMEQPGGMNLAVALGVTAVPVGDVVLTIARRWLRGKSIFTADQGHVHHILLRKWSRPALVLGVLVAMAAAQAAAVLLRPDVFGLAIVVALWGALCGYLIWGARDRIGELLHQRRSFKRLNLLRAYAHGSLRLAEAPEDVRPILEHVAQGLDITNLRLRDIAIRHHNGGSRKMVIETLACGQTEAEFSFPPRSQSALDDERRTLICDVLRMAESVLVQLDRAPTEAARNGR